MPPSVKIGMLVACRPIDPSSSGSELRAKFAAFLDSEPVRAFVRSLTHVPPDASWKNLAGHGPRTWKPPSQQATTRWRVFRSLQALAASYRAMHDAYAEREAVFAAVMADRRQWETATRQQRQLAVAADTELRRRHPGQQHPPLRSAEPAPATQAQRGELTLTPGEEIPQLGQWIAGLAAQHRAFAGKLAERQTLMIPAEDPDYEDLGPAFPAWAGPDRDAILQPPKPQIQPSPQILERAAGRDLDMEAAE